MRIIASIIGPLALIVLAILVQVAGKIILSSI